MSSVDQDNSSSKPTDWREWLNRLVRYKDTTLISSALAENLETIHKEFTFLDGDIVVASHPKSGTTWMQNIVSLLMNGDNSEKVKGQPLYLRVPWLEGKEDPECDWGYKLLEARSSQRFMKTHVYGSLVPPAMLQKAKIVYIVRNPKDVAVSYFHMHRAYRLLPYVPWDEFITELFLPGNLLYGPWHKHAIYWWEMSKSRPNILFVHYEALVKELKAHIEKIATFLGKKLTVDAIEKVVEESSFTSMKANRDVNYSQVWAMGHEISPFIRKGKVGDWMNYFTTAQNRLFEQKFEAWMAQSDLKIDFV
ncbi:MAG: sulfotransferase domain-containing protein [Xenococcaceae cyanobacterium]